MASGEKLKTVTDEPPRKDQQKKDDRSHEADYEAEGTEKVSAALAKLTCEIAAFREQFQTDNQANERERRKYETGEQANWTKIAARAGICFSILSLALSAFTLIVLYRTLGVYQGQATIMATQAVIMDKQREIADKQNANLKGQLDDFEAVEAAAISIQNFSITGFPHARVKFELVNSGPTEAKDIGLIVGYAGGPMREPLGPGEREGVGMAPTETGFSMGAGERRKYDYTLDFWSLPKGIKIPAEMQKRRPTPSKIKRGEQGFYMSLGMAYRDKFGKAHSTSDCLAYNSKSRHYEPCFGGHFMR